MTDDKTVKTVPLINPDAEPHLIKLFRQSIKSHDKAAERCEALAGLLDDYDPCDKLKLDRADVDLIIEALVGLAAKHEDSAAWISSALQSAGVDESADE